MNTWPVREAELSDWPAIQRFFKSLDQESRYMYFGFHASDLVIAQTWDRFQANEHKFFVVEIACNVVGVCQVAHQASHAEISVAVARSQRKQGVAHSLVERAVTWCKTHGIKDLMMYCLPDNDVIPKILKKHQLLPLMLSKPAEARFWVPEPNLSDIEKEWYSTMMSNWMNLTKKLRPGYYSKTQPSPKS